jgi:DNA-binding CsgD family transcriptional regulator
VGKQALGQAVFAMELLERSRFIDALDAFLHEASAGHGRLVFVSGEAGIGKTALVQAFCQMASTRARVALASCDALSTPGPLGPLTHIAPALGLQLDLLQPQTSREHLYHQINVALQASDRPTVLVGEDAHWADEATLNHVRFLGRRVDALPALVIVTFRDDELGPSHPLRLILGDLITAPAVRRLTLPRLTADAVRTMAADHPIAADALHRLTGGNPFFVTEVLTAGTPGLPASVCDAVLARAARLSPAARRALDAAAVLGSPIDPALLAAVVEESAEQAAEEWLAVGIAECRADALTFRHELGREAILAVMSPVRRLVLHRRILAAMEQDSGLRQDEARLAHHAEAAGDRDAVLRYAPAAAQRAAALRAHREAAAQFARALRFADHLPSEQRAELLERRAHECYLTGLLEDAIAASQAAFTLWRAAGNRLKEGDGLRRLSRFHWFIGNNAAAEQTAREALTVLERLPPGPELAWSYSNQAQLRMLNRDLVEAVRWGERAIGLAERVDEPEVLVHALNNVGTAKLGLEDECGRPLLERSLALAQQHGFEDHVSRALFNLAWAATISYQLDRAEKYVAAGIAHTTEHDLDAMGRYLLNCRAFLRLRRGDWAGAVDDATIVQRDPATNRWSRVGALTVLGYVQIRRGEIYPAALDEALALATGTDELIRLGPVRAARAEAAWLAGDTAGAIEEARAMLEVILRGRHRWLAGELALTLHRAGERHLPEEGLAEPFAAQIRGEWQRAAEQWQALGCPLEAARALAAGDAAAVHQAWTIFDRLGARLDAAMAAKRLRQLGVHRLPRGPRPTTRANPARLTRRELDVLALIAEGQLDREIAARLFLSPRTVGHHVSAILAKLGARSRAEAAQASTRLLQNGDLAPPI